MSTAGGQEPNFYKHVALSTGGGQAGGGQREQSSPSPRWGYQTCRHK